MGSQDQHRTHEHIGTPAHTAPDAAANQTPGPAAQAADQARTTPHPVFTNPDA